jgi:hypothetical protein
MVAGVLRADYDGKRLRLRNLSGIQLQALRGGRARYASIHLTLFKVVNVAGNLVAVLLKSGPFSGKIAIIAEIIDHNRVRRLVFACCFALKLS